MNFFKKFCESPGSDGPGYGKQGGLLARVVRLAEHTEASLGFYGATDNEKAVAITAALLCRVGATDTYEFQDCVPSVTDRGRLMGVHNLSMSRINAALRRLSSKAKEDGTPMKQDTLLRVLHAVISANQPREIKPMTKEAMVLARMLNADNEIVNAIDFIESDVNSDENFTAYDPHTGRRYYTG